MPFTGAEFNRTPEYNRPDAPAPGEYLPGDRVDRYLLAKLSAAAARAIERADRIIGTAPAPEAPDPPPTPDHPELLIDGTVIDLSAHHSTNSRDLELAA